MNARTTDPTTSHEAAARLPEFAPALRARILDVLKAYGPMSAEEIGDTLGNVDNVKVARRTSDLKRDGLIFVFEAGGYLNRSGRRADVYAIAEVF